MKTRFSGKFTAKEIRDRSPVWLKFINHIDRANLEARRNRLQAERKNENC